MQQLCDTSSIRTACNGADYGPQEDRTRRLPTSRLEDDSRHIQTFDSHLKHWRTVLDEYSYSFANLDTTMAIYSVLDENETIAATLFECLKWLTSNLPRGFAAKWSNVNFHVQQGLMCPEKLSRHFTDRRASQMVIMDSLDERTSFDLFCRLLAVMAARTSNEIDCSRTVGGADSADRMLPSEKTLISLVINHISNADADSLRAPTLVWMKKAFLAHWNNRCCLPRASIAAIALRIITSCDIPEIGPIDITFKKVPVIPARLDANDVARSYLDSEGDDNNVHVLDFPALFNLQELAIYFRTINHTRMHRAHSDTEKAEKLHERYERLLDLDDEPEGRIGWLQEHYLLLNISRQDVIQDAFDQLWQRRKSELFRPLRVRLGETDVLEVGHDLGGVQIEFFNLVWRELLNEKAGMFTTDASTALTYFRPGSLQPLYMFELAGLLFGIAVYNGITLPVDFPLAMYEFFTPDKDLEPAISDRWPDVARSLQNILDQNVLGLEVVVPLEANGLRLSVLADECVTPNCVARGRVPLHVVDATRIVHHRANTSTAQSVQEDVDIEDIEEAWPGWRLLRATREPADVTPQNKHRYVAAYKHWLVWGSVAPQVHAFRKGVETILPTHHMSFLTPEQLRDIVEGTKTFAVADLRHATEYENYDANCRYIRSFWRLVSSWTEDKQRQLLKFVTAIERLPANGAGNFSFKIERPRPEETDSLPTSSTCFRTLYLPKYPNADVLDQKLTLAFEYGLEGFGTG